MNTITFLTGGARSGKSSFALQLSEAYEHRTFVATAQAIDDEMDQRIKLHQKDRGANYATIEAPIDLARAVENLGLSAGNTTNATRVAVIDCLTVWMGNLLHKHGMQEEPYQEVQDFLQQIVSPPCDLVIVANELGMGLVPETPMGRWFRDRAGRLNQSVAKIAHRTGFLVSGQPLWVKNRS